MATQHSPAPVDAALSASYQQAIYIVSTDSGDVRFGIGVPSQALRALLQQHGANEAAFVTAANPGSVLQSDAVNDAAHAALTAHMEKRGYRWMPGVARDPRGIWPDEPSILVPGVGRDAARKIGDRFGQLATVWIDGSGIPGLLWCHAAAAPGSPEAR